MQTANGGGIASVHILQEASFRRANVHYGYVRDLLVSKEGQLQAVIVNSDGGYDHGAGGFYAYPFYGYQHGHGYGQQQGWNPGDPYYNLPYSRVDIADLLPYAYRKQKAMP